MSSKIDQRIVEMSFENHKFEKGIQQSKNSLKEFSDALKNSGTGKEFTGLEKGIGSLSSSFSVLEQIGIGALRRIGEAAVNAGTQMLKHLTVDPLLSGWTKYEQKTASVQTIMNATGKSIDEVNGYLNKLMWFSDETSYGFTDMTAALAQMTSSGGKIDSLIPLITGVANATAYAGKGAAEFSRAMYNLNQSYGAGNLQYMDWRSLELAGVAGKDLKQIFIDTAIALGKLDKSGRTAKGTLVDIGTFGTTLQERWADTKVMEAAFGKFSELSEAAYELVNNGTYDTAAEAMESLAGQYSAIAEKGFKSAQQAKSFSESINATLDAVSSGWMRTYEIIFGNLEEATRNFTAFTEILWTVFAASAEGRNEMLAWVKQAGGISNVFQGIKNIAIALLKILQPISQAFDQFFPPKTKEQWLGITESFKTFTEHLMISEETAGKIQRTFAGLFAVMDIGWQVVKFLGSSLFEVIKIFVPVNSGILGATASLGDLLVMLNRMVKSSEIFKYGLLGIKIAVVLVRDIISNIIGKVSEFVYGLWTAERPLEYIGKYAQKMFGGIVENVKMAASWVGDKFVKALSKAQEFIDSKFGKSTIGTLSTIVSIIKDAIGFVLNKATGGLKDLGQVIKDLDFNKIATFVTGGVLLLFVNQLTQLSKAMSGLVNNASSFVGNWNKKLFKTTTGIKDYAYVIGILSASLFVLSKIPWDDLKKGLTGMAGAIGLFVVAYAGIQTINVIASKVLKDQEMVKSAFNLVGIAAGLAIMAGAIRTISKIDDTDIWRSVGVLGTMIGFLAGYQAVTAYISNMTGQKAFSMKVTGMAAGLLGLVGIIMLLKVISISDIIAGLGKITTILVTLGLVSQVFAVAARIGGGNKLSANILGMATGVLVMIGVMKLLAGIDTDMVTGGMKNLAIIGTILAGLELLFGLAGRISGGSKLKSNMLSIQLGMLSMIGLIAILNSMTQPEIDNGILSLAKMAGIISAIQILTATSAKLAGGNKTQKILGSVTITMTSFVGIIAILKNMTQSEIDKGILTLTKMAGIIVAIGLLTALTGKLQGDTKSAVSMVGVVAVILTLTASMALLSIIDQPTLRQAVISIGFAAVAFSAIAVGFGIMMKALSDMTSKTNIFKTIVQGLGVLAGVLIASIAFFGTLKIIDSIIKDISMENLTKFIAGLGVVSSIIVAFATIPFGAKGPNLQALISGFESAAGAVLGTMVFFGALKLILPIIKDIQWNDLMIFTAGLTIVSGLIAALALLGPALILVGSVPLQSLAGVGTLIVSVAGIILGFAGLSALMSLFDPNILIAGIESLVLVGEGLGRFVGALVGGFVMESLTDIGKGLVGFAESLATFNPSSINGIKGLAEALLIITGAAVVDGISRFINSGSSSTKVFGEQLKGLVDAFNQISITDAQRTTDILAVMGPMAQNLKDIANAAKDIPNSGGFLGDFLGNNDMGNYGMELSEFISELNVKGIDTTTTKHAVDVLAGLAPMAENLKTVANAAKNIPNSGGFLGEFMGENDIDKFGPMLVGFIDVLKVVDIDTGIKPASAALKAMVPMVGGLRSFAEVAKEIPNSGGFMGWLLGNNDINTFGTKLAELINIFSVIDTSLIRTSSINLSMMSNSVLPALSNFATFADELNGKFTGSSTLYGFALDLVNFINMFKEADFTVIPQAMKSLSQITETFNVIGKDVMRNAKESFENNQAPFQMAITIILDKAIRTVEAKRYIMVNAMTDIFESVIDKSQKYVMDFKTLGSDLIKGLKTGIESEKSVAVNAIKSVSTSIINSSKYTFDVNSPSKIFESIGGWCTKGLANGILKETKVAEQAGITMSRDVEEAIRDSLGVHSISDVFSNIGGWIPKSLDEGIQNGKGFLTNTAKDLGIDTSNVTLDGIKDTITNGEGGVTSGIKNLLDILTGSSPILDSAQNTGSNIGDNITNAMQGALGDAQTGLGGSRTQEVVRSALDKLQSMLDEEKYYGRLSLDEELKHYEALRLVKGQGDEDYKKINREVYRLVKEIYESQLAYIEEVSKTEEDAADKRKKLYSDYQTDMASINEETLKKLDDIQTRYDSDRLSTQEASQKKIAEQDKKYHENYNAILDNAEKERQRIREDYASQQKSINEKLLSDIDAQNKAYEDAVKSRADTIYGSYGLFAAVEKDAEVNGEDLLQNLRDQGAALSDWEQSLDALAARGVDIKLIEELQAMGPSSKAQIKALLTLTDEQLDEYVSLFQGKYAFARIKAETELEGLKDSTQKAIQELNTQAVIDLADLELGFINSMSNINTKMSLDLTELKDSYDLTMTEINDETTLKLAQLEEEFIKSTSEINIDADEKLRKLKKSYNDSLIQINTDTDNKLKELQSKFSSTMKNINAFTEADFKKLIGDNKVKLEMLNVDTKSLLKDVEQTYSASGDTILSNFDTDMRTLNNQTSQEMDNLSQTVDYKLDYTESLFRNAGQNAAYGFAEGIRNGTYMAVMAAEFLATQAIIAAERILEINSPSKIFEGIGQFTSLGFANGIQDYAYKATDASQKMARGPIAAVSKALAELDDIVDLGTWEPVIKPIMDLSNIKSKSIDRFFGKDYSLALGSTQMANETIQNGSRERVSSEPSIINNFDLRGIVVRSEADIDAIASKLHQKQQIALRGKGGRTILTR